MIVNQQTKTSYKYETQEEAIEAEGKLPDFDSKYERYEINATVDSEGNLYITDKTIEDLNEPVFVAKLDSEVFALNDKELLDKQIYQRFDISPVQFGYDFVVNQEKELNTESDLSYR